jgi:hypothetical protein
MRIWLAGGHAPHTQLITLGQLSAQDPLMGASPSGHVLFSGTAGDGRRVSLVDASGRVLQYEARGGDTKVVYAAAEPVAMSYGDGPPMALKWNDFSPGAFTLALPPWFKNVQVEGFAGKDATWRPLKSTDGVSGPLPLFGVTGHGYVEGLGGGMCGTGVLLRAEDRAGVYGDEPRVAVFLYKPGWPYAVRLAYFPNPGMNSYGNRHDAAPVDQPFVRRMASALLCEDGGIDEFQPASDVEWTEMWRGRPYDGAGRESVVEQTVRQPQGREEEDFKTTFREVGIDKASVYARLSVDTSAQQAGVVACMPAGDKLAVIGPKNATDVRLLDGDSGRIWSARGNFLTVAKSELSGPSHKSPHLIAFSVTGGKDGGVDSAACPCAHG